MTLHIAYITKNLVCIVGDRLLTTGNVRARNPWDTYANKTILLTSRSSRFVISYAGAGLIGDLQTDEWLVNKILGRSVGGRGHAAAMSVGDYKTNIRQVFDRLESAMSLEFNALPEQAVSGGMQVLIAGWMWKRRKRNEGRRARPFWLKLVHTGVRSAPLVITGDMKQKWGPSTRISLPTAGANIEYLSLDIQKFVLETDLTEPLAVESGLIQLLRCVARDPLKGIGTEVVSVILESSGAARVRFIRDTRLSHTTAAYSPYILNRQLIAHPAELVGGGLTIGGIPFECVPPLPVNGWASMRSYERRRQ